ncbi:MAG: ethanolamine ammonia-lyase light chain EutC [Bradyrhizobium sp.]|nr:ethanolamine ammonia-lyase light chain EutC [Bradyrhizobium sp.]
MIRIDSERLPASQHQHNGPSDGEPISVVLRVRTAAKDWAEYLRRPDIGRRLSPEGRALLRTQPFSFSRDLLLHPPANGMLRVVDVEP